MAVAGIWHVTRLGSIQSFWLGMGRGRRSITSSRPTHLRRHLTPSQLAVVAIKALPFYQKEAKDRQRLSKGRGNKGAQTCATLKGKATEWAAKRVGVGVRLVEMAKKVQEADPKLIAEIEAGADDGQRSV